ncbi:DUF2267 domain-containing protein [Geodermatophilus sp. SYSU D00758]
MLSYQELVEDVEQRAGLDDADQAVVALTAVLTTVAGAVAPEQRRALAAVVPGSLRPVVENAPPVQAEDTGDLVRRVARRADVTEERARYEAHAVLSCVAEAEPEVAEQVRQDLPADAADLFSAALPSQAASVAASQPTQLTQLTPDDVRAVLAQLPGWSGDTSGLRRTVVLDPGQGRPLLARIHRAEQDLHHRALVEELPDGVALVLRTRSCDCVTDLDVALARRIQEVLDGTGGGPPARQW